MVIKEWYCHNLGIVKILVSSIVHCFNLVLVLIYNIEGRHVYDVVFMKTSVGKVYVV